MLETKHWKEAINTADVQPLWSTPEFATSTWTKFFLLNLTLYGHCCHMATDFILLCLKPDDFTCQGEAPGNRSVKGLRKRKSSFSYKVNYYYPKTSKQMICFPRKYCLRTSTNYTLTLIFRSEVLIWSAMYSLRPK